ncbi:MAG: hypothetical protein EXR28_05340 [Betaproteobacteria bacterium]|nr:hypothetical protein [Betaproteobacteria bacterium]
MRIEKLKANFDVVVNLVHFPLHAETPAEGLSLDVLFAGSKAEERAARQVRMKGLMDAEGLPYGERTHTYNSRLAQELGKWGDTQQGGAAIHDAIYKAYFVDGKNIGDIETLVALAQSVGLSADAARKVLTERKFKDAIDEDWTSSRKAGVTGVPTFASGGYGVVGAQPYEVLENLMAKVGATPR